MERLREVMLFFAQKAFIINDGKLLLIKKDAGESAKCANKYELPGGRMDYGETVDEALKREVFEEVGIEIIPGRPLDTFEFYFERDGKRHQVVALVRFCEPINLSVTSENQVTSDHIAGIEWVPLPKVKDLDLISDVKPIILRAVEELLG